MGLGLGVRVRGQVQGQGSGSGSGSGAHTVAAWVTYGCSQGYLRLQVGDVFRDRASMKLIGLHPEMEARAGVKGRVGDALRVGVRRWRRGLGLGVGLGRR